MYPIGMAAVVVVLAVGGIAGAWWKRSNGRLRDVAPRTGAASSGAMGGSAARGAALGGEAAGHAAPMDLREERSDVAASLIPAPGLPLDPAVLAGLGVERGHRVTLLQFSSAFCAPCRAVRRISAEVAGEIAGVRHIEVDAEEHLDVVRTLGIWRTPTLLVLDRDGRVVKRATGVPKKPHLVAAVTESL